MTLASSSLRLPFAISSKTICASCRLRSLREFSRFASTARPLPRSTTLPAGRASRGAIGAFRPELVRFMNKQMVLVTTNEPIMYKLGLYSLAFICFSYSVTNYFTIFYEPPTPPSTFVKGSMGSIIAAMACIGVVCIFKTRRIVSRITSIPYTKDAKTGQTGLMLRIETFRSLPIPGLPKKTTEIPAEAITTSDALGIPGLLQSTPNPPTEDERIAERIWLREQARREHKYNMERILTLPFRQFGSLLSRSFHGMRDLMAGDGFVHIAAKGRNGTWKVDRDFDWALDHGHAFDKVVRVNKEGL